VDPPARDRLNAVPDHGRIRATLTAEGPSEEPEFADPSWGPAWTAARDYLHLLRTAPDRIRAALVLHGGVREPGEGVPAPGADGPPERGADGRTLNT
jgi:hypothetical protein